MIISTKLHTITNSIQLRALFFAAIAVLMILPGAPAPDQRRRPDVSHGLGSCVAEYTFGHSEPESEGVSIEGLLELTNWVKQSRVPILSVLISHNGRIVYELYTSSIRQNEAHYLMSVTKSMTSALVGVAIGH